VDASLEDEQDAVGGEAVAGSEAVPPPEA
jgi:hypothetical protein